MVEGKVLSDVEVLLSKCIDMYMIDANQHNVNYTTTSCVACYNDINSLLKKLIDFKTAQCQAVLDFSSRSIPCESAL